MKKFSHNKSFTLLELIIVTSIIAMVGTSTYSVLRNGISIWQRINKVSKEEDVRLFFEKITNDVHNMVVFSPIPFRGSSQIISFPCIEEINFRPGMKGATGAIEQIKFVRYKFLAHKRLIIKESADYLQFSDHDAKNQSAVALKNVILFELAYYYRQDNGKLVQKLLPDPGLTPSCIKISLTFDNGARERKVFSETIEVPIAYKSFI